MGSLNQTPGSVSDTIDTIKRGEDEYFSDEGSAGHRRFRGGGAGLRTALDLVNSTNSELHIVTVGREYHPSDEIPEYGTRLEEMLRRLERQAQGMLDEQVRKIEETRGTVAQAHLRMQGRPDREIVRLS